MGRSDDGNDAFPGGSGVEQPEHAVFVSAFVLDKYEVTVGRFRRFLQVYDGTPPRANTGANPHVRGSGWQSAWNSALPADAAALAASVKCEASYQTWTDVRTRNDLLPINCVSFPVAFAFCIWDGGRLPSEVEWELAASGGEENRLYPWGAAPPTEELAVFDCNGGGSPGSCAFNDVRPVGSRPKGNGRFGHADLAGSMMELTRDTYNPAFYANAGAREDNAINLERDAEATAQVSARGGNVLNSGAEVRAQVRSNPNRSSRFNGVGMRCARDP
jgi:formylglycine-generating enzyme required for sulfatase activity